MLLNYKKDQRYTGITIADDSISLLRQIIPPLDTIKRQDIQIGQEMQKKYILNNTKASEEAGTIPISL